MFSISTWVDESSAWVRTENWGWPLPWPPLNLGFPRSPATQYPRAGQGRRCLRSLTTQAAAGSHPPKHTCALLSSSAQTILLGVGQRWGGGLISSILSILDPSFEVVLDTVLSKSHDCNSFAQIRLSGEKEGINLPCPGLDRTWIKSCLCHAFGHGLNSKGADWRVKSSQKCKAIYYLAQEEKKTKSWSGCQSNKWRVKSLKVSIFCGNWKYLFANFQASLFNMFFWHNVNEAD